MQQETQVFFFMALCIIFVKYFTISTGQSSMTSPYKYLI